MRTKDIEIGRRYTCKIRGKERVAVVESIDTERDHSHRVKIVAVLEGSGRITFRSPSRLLAPLGAIIPNVAS